MEGIYKIETYDKVPQTVTCLFSSFYIAGFVGYEWGRSRLSVFGIPSLVRVLKMKQTNSKPLKPYERTARQNLLRSRRCLTHDPYRVS